MKKPVVAYYRVSTEKQGQSGLGLEAQKKALQDFIRKNDFKLLREYTEIESGSVDMRPVLQAALHQCKKQNAVLLIAKLDRLARNVAFISTLMQSKVKFISVDNPNADKFMTHIMAAVGEFERELISIRTRQALQAAKNRGVELGKHGKYVLSQENKKNADAFALEMFPVVEKLKQRGHKSVRSLVRELNRQNIKTFSGGEAKWHTHTVFSIMKRMKKLNTDQA